MKNKEIEIQVRIENSKSLTSFLKENARFKEETYQKDEYFTPFHRNFLGKKPVAEWLRLREDEGGSITYKNWHFEADGKSHYCDEFETKVDNLDALRKIFKVLDFKNLVIVEKKRKSWHYKDWEVSVDQVTDLGDFVEIEYKGEEEIQPQEETDKMINFLKDMGCGKIERNFVGYPFLLLFGEKDQFEEV